MDMAATAWNTVDLCNCMDCALSLQALEPVWDGDSLDWKEIPADEITQRVVSRVGPGSIVLFHNAAIHTPEALPGVISCLLQEGYTFVPISQIILPGTCGTDYTIDHTGRQQSCA